MKNYPIMDPSNKGGRFIYTVLGDNPDEDINLADRFKGVLSYLSDETINSPKFDNFLNFIAEDKTLFILSHRQTAINWDLIKEYAQRDDLTGIHKGIAADVNKLYGKLSKHENENLPEL